MQTARDPNATSSHRILKRKWEKVLANSEEYVERMPHTTWPPAQTPLVSTGKNIKKIFLITTHTHTRTHTQIQIGKKIKIFI
jgi:hypothetical protein